EFQKDYYHFIYDRLMRFPAEQAMYAATYARRTLEAGFTTVRNVGAYDFVDVGLRNAINAGVAEGPRILTAVHGIGSPGGHFDDRSEEHTSELQSREKLVCRLLLEKKKQKKN